jgi:translocator protein
MSRRSAEPAPPSFRSGSHGAPENERASPWTILAYVGAVVAVSVIGSVATQSAVDTWYAELDRPWFTPPRWVFGPVWTVLYALIALSAFLTHRARRPAGPQLWLWWGQLALNLAWTLVFFGLRAPLGGFIVIVALLAAIIALTVWVWPVRKVAALLLVPYAIWVAYALALNLGILLSN